MKYNSLQLAVIGVLQEKKITHPNQQAIDVHEPEKDEITADDFKKLRSMKKTKSGKLHNCATHIEHAEYGEGVCIKEAHADPDSEGNIAWYTVQFEDGSVRKIQTESMKIIAAEGHVHEEVEQIDETIEQHESFNIELKDSYTFGDYLTAAKKLVGEEKAVELANTAFNSQDLNIFIEQISHSAVEEKINAHMKAGHKVTMPKYITRDGKPRAEYIVTDKETGVRRKYIHQGNVTKVENMGARGKKD